MGVIDVVRRIAVTLQHAFDGNFRIAGPLTRRAAEAVVEHQLDAGAAQRLAIRRAIENDILHGLATQLFGLRFAQYPAHRVDDVGLTATVRADHANQLARHVDVSRFRKGLESGKLKVS